MSLNRVSNLALAPLIRPNKTILNLKSKKNGLECFRIHVHTIRVHSFESLCIYSGTLIWNGNRLNLLYLSKVNVVSGTGDNSQDLPNDNPKIRIDKTIVFYFPMSANIFIREQIRINLKICGMGYLIHWEIFFIRKKNSTRRCVKPFSVSIYILVFGCIENVPVYMYFNFWNKIHSAVLYIY